MGYILEDRPDAVRVNGWYGGRNKKYYDMFDLTADKRFAKVFESEENAQKVADSLNKIGWHFVVVEQRKNAMSSKYEDYIARYCRTGRYTPDEARQQAISREVEKFYENENRADPRLRNEFVCLSES